MNKLKRSKLIEADSFLTKARNMLFMVKEKEQDDLDNCPDNLQGGERYAAMENAIDELEEAIENIEQASKNIYSAI